jgi:hypothetical protein
VQQGADETTSQVQAASDNHKLSASVVKGAVIAGAAVAATAACAEIGPAAPLCGLAAAALTKWIIGAVGPVLADIDHYFDQIFGSPPPPVAGPDSENAMARAVYDGAWAHYCAFGELDVAGIPPGLIDVVTHLQNVYRSYGLPPQPDSAPDDGVVESSYDPAPFLNFWAGVLGLWPKALYLQRMPAAGFELKYWMPASGYPNGYRTSVKPDDPLDDAHDDTQRLSFRSSAMRGWMPPDFASMMQWALAGTGAASNPGGAAVECVQVQTAPASNEYPNGRFALDPNLNGICRGSEQWVWYRNAPNFQKPGVYHYLGIVMRGFGPSATPDPKSATVPGKQADIVTAAREWPIILKQAATLEMSRLAGLQASGIVYSNITGKSAPISGALATPATIAQRRIKLDTLHGVQFMRRQDKPRASAGKAALSFLGAAAPIVPLVLL